MRRAFIQFAVSSWQYATCLIVLFFANCQLQTASCQGIHFSQYFNAPLLLNPANAALMPESDYRIGMNYRNQWSSIPVPYNTFMAYGDFQAIRNKAETNWLGIGAAVFNDRVGDGDLSLTKVQGVLAYHVQLSTTTMVSAGLSGAWSQRSVDFNMLTFDLQWNGQTFDRNLPSGESGYRSKTHFMEVGAGVNFAWFPNENTYFKLGLGADRLNRPRESFYGRDNQLGVRPTANLDVLLKAGATTILNPSVYYTQDKGAYELVAGTQFNFLVSGMYSQLHSQLILGAYYRVKESVIGVVGYHWNKVRVTGSYDYTLSKLTALNKGAGAFEVSLRYEGLYGGTAVGRRTYGCPRF